MGRKVFFHRIAPLFIGKTNAALSRGEEFDG